MKRTIKMNERGLWQSWYDSCSERCVRLEEQLAALKAESSQLKELLQHSDDTAKSLGQQLHEVEKHSRKGYEWKNCAKGGERCEQTALRRKGNSDAQVIGWHYNEWHVKVGEIAIPLFDPENWEYLELSEGE